MIISKISFPLICRKDIFQEIVQSKAMFGIQWQRFPILNSLLKGHRRGKSQKKTYDVLFRMLRN